MSDLLAMAILVVLALVLGIVVLRLWRGLRRFQRGPKPGDERSKLPKKPKPSENGILVDGSNVMYWSGEPSSLVLWRVIDKLKDLGFQPHVVFDASAGYRLSDRYLDDAPMAAMIDLPTSRVLVVQRGQVADEVILRFAKESGYRIVTNDRYRDWSVEFPLVKEKKRLVKGEWRQGSVVFRGLG